MNTHHIKVPGFLDDHPGTTTKILCPYCGCLHVHGRSPGNRIPHCENRDGLPEYRIILTDVSLPPEALRVGRKARRLGRHSNKPDIAYEEEVEGLAAEARELNGQILTEVAHTE